MTRRRSRLRRPSPSGSELATKELGLRQAGWRTGQRTLHIREPREARRGRSPLARVGPDVSTEAAALAGPASLAAIASLHDPVAGFATAGVSPTGRHWTGRERKDDVLLGALAELRSDAIAVVPQDVTTLEPPGTPARPGWRRRGRAGVRTPEVRRSRRGRGSIGRGGRGSAVAEPADGRGLHPVAFWSVRGRACARGSRT